MLNKNFLCNSFRISLLIAFFLPFIVSCHTRRQSPPPFDITKGNYLFMNNESTARSHLPLSGKNSVILNSGSKLYKPINKRNDTHDLYLDGDAFFKIDDSIDSPVVIHTGMLNLITSHSFFRVMAHQKDPGQTVEVLRGKMIAEKAYPSEFPDTELLQGGEMVMINRDIDLMEKETFDTTRLSSWLLGNIIFQHTPFNDAMRILEDWYNVKIEISTSNRNLGDSAYDITESFHGAGLRTVLDSLAERLKFNFIMTENRVEVSF